MDVKDFYIEVQGLLLDVGIDLSGLQIANSNVDISQFLNEHYSNGCSPEFTADELKIVLSQSDTLD